MVSLLIPRRNNIPETTHPYKEAEEGYTLSGWLMAIDGDNAGLGRRFPFDTSRKKGTNGDLITKKIKKTTCPEKKEDRGNIYLNSLSCPSSAGKFPSTQANCNLRTSAAMQHIGALARG